jgi:hypothetical protein
MRLKTPFPLKGMTHSEEDEHVVSLVVSGVSRHRRGFRHHRGVFDQAANVHG